MSGGTEPLQPTASLVLRRLGVSAAGPDTQRQALVDHIDELTDAELAALTDAGLLAPA